jgi:hypothetical protein
MTDLTELAAALEAHDAALADGYQPLNGPAIERLQDAYAALCDAAEARGWKQNGDYPPKTPTNFALRTLLAAERAENARLSRLIGSAALKGDAND